MENLKQPVRWLRSYFEDDDTLFLFEADEDGWVLRQVELEGPERRPVVAASRAEWPEAEAVGLAAVQEYEQRYGGLADKPISGWDPDFPHDEITREEFEAIWRDARSFLERRSAGIPVASGPEGRNPEPVGEYGDLRCLAIRWVSDEPQPGWVEVLMTDADGRTWRFFDKPPIFHAGDHLRSDSDYPVPVVIRVRVLDQGEPLTVSTDPHGVESEEGETTFRVNSSDVLR